MKVSKQTNFGGDDRYTNNIRDRILSMARELYVELAKAEDGPGDWSNLPPFSEQNVLRVTVEVEPPKK
ncbi:MAG: hypothetical protein WHU10_00100 [Fimbriimonadales bacterium]